MLAEVGKRKGGRGERNEGGSKRRQRRLFLQSRAMMISPFSHRVSRLSSKRCGACPRAQRRAPSSPTRRTARATRRAGAATEHRGASGTRSKQERARRESKKSRSSRAPHTSAAASQRPWIRTRFPRGQAREMTGYIAGGSLRREGDARARKRPKLGQSQGQKRRPRASSASSGDRRRLAVMTILFVPSPGAALLLSSTFCPERKVMDSSERNRAVSERSKRGERRQGGRHRHQAAAADARGAGYCRARNQGKGKKLTGVGQRDLGRLRGVEPEGPLAHAQDGRRQAALELEGGHGLGGSLERKNKGRV